MERRYGIRRLLASALSLMLITGMAGHAEPEETALISPLELPVLETGRLITIPVEQDSQKAAIAPRDGNYLYDAETGEPMGYSDPSITVNMGRGRIYETNYLYAWVKIADGSQIRTLLASPPGNANTTPGHDLARRVMAVIAINGDYCGGEDYTRGALIRQGKLWRLKCDGQSDLLMIDAAGDLTILENATNKDVEAVQDQAVNLFTFGPALVVNGEPKYGVRMNKIGSQKAAQRMAICQTGPLEYLLITSAGPENSGNTGLKLDQFVELIASFPDVKTAYNLDGGSSSTMVFRKGDSLWAKINVKGVKVRPIQDLIYFADAWKPSSGGK